MYVRKESLDIVCHRMRALKALQWHQEEGRQVIYLDKTWFTTRMHHSKEWVDTTQDGSSSTYSCQMPPVEGERFMVVTTGTANGFTEGSFLCYTAKNTSSDYHGEINSELFLWWLMTQILPSLPELSVSVLDNTPYHTQLMDESRCPTTVTKKANLIAWVEHHRLPIPPAATWFKLLLLCQQNRPNPQYTMDDTICQ